ncbi:MAG: hypothetical protein JO250_04385 [Armatimonadetes bacterium]|nr:hypothetical protein [Armatimonadota bacterium]
MEFVMGGLFALAVGLIALWAWSLAVSTRRDRQEAQEREREEQARREREAREARLYRRGEPLRCLNCGFAFRGPLPDTGCPQCHLAALVVTEAEARKEQINGNSGH